MYDAKASIPNPPQKKMYKQKLILTMTNPVVLNKCHTICTCILIIPQICVTIIHYVGSYKLELLKVIKYPDNTHTL